MSRKDDKHRSGGGDGKDEPSTLARRGDEYTDNQMPSDDLDEQLMRVDKNGAQSLMSREETKTKWPQVPYPPRQTRPGLPWRRPILKDPQVRRRLGQTRPGSP
ncbi:hypothetical protein PG994_009570 [Apiospora phragmitis]|uniref:Uncharacterized protein n=1 Tax=Apiospora phragmitis TaxID=2905665 RepID=A0ABR1U6J7_9PEZI